MSQTTLDDEELFSEAASEMRADVDASLDRTTDALPDPETLWSVDSENTLGVLNALRSSLDVGDAREHLRDAKKWYTMGEQADAFEDPEALAADIERVEGLLATVEDAREQASDLASTIPQLKSDLEAAEDPEPEAEGDSDLDPVEA
mgnify:CR=1 FL=1